MAGCSSFAPRAASGSSPLSGAWLLEITSDDVGYTRTVVNIAADGEHFEGHARDGAAGDIVNWWNLAIGKLFTPYFQYGALLHLNNGRITPQGNGSALSAVVVTAIGTMGMEATLRDGKIEGTLNRNGEPCGTVAGVRNTLAMPLDDYPSIADSALALTEQRIYDRSIIRSGAWSTFADEVREMARLSQDDLELLFGFYYTGRTLPFSHYGLYQKPALNRPEVEPKEKNIELNILPGSVAHLRIASFAGGSGEIDDVFRQVISGGYDNLIIDLRGNQGGNLSAMRVAAHLIDSARYGGAFVTARWFAEHSAPPTVGQYGMFPVLAEADLAVLFKGIHEQQGMVLKVTPDRDRYRGRVFVLTDGATASACEPLVYAIRQYGLGRIIGERTAGAMLSSEEFPIRGNWFLLVPTADYYTADGHRLDGVGVEPDVKVKSAEALDYALAEAAR